MSLFDEYSERARKLVVGFAAQHLGWQEQQDAIALALKQTALESRAIALSEACMNGGIWRATELTKARARLKKLTEEGATV